MQSSGGYLFATLATGAAPATAPQVGLRWRGPWASDPFLTGSGCMRSWNGAAVVAAFWLARCVPPQRRRPHPAGDGASMRTDFRAFLLGGLLVAVVVLGYLYWERQRNTVEIKLPAITIEKH
jgi:hypothetical protein